MVSPGFGPRDDRANEITPVVSLFNAVMPADEPLGGVCAGVDESHVTAGCTASAGSVTLAGNGDWLTGGISVILSWFRLAEFDW